MALTRITKGVIKPNENYDTHNINSTGIVTAIGLDVNGNGDISGNLNIGGVLTYEDVTSIDSVGIITARNGIDCNGDLDVDGHTNLDNVSIAGVTTITGALFADGFGTTGGEIALTGTVPRIGFTDSNANSDFRIKVDGGSFQIEDITNSSADRFTINSSGNATFSGAVTLGNGSGLNFGDTSARIRGESGASGLLRFDTNGGERLRINNTGWMGAGQTTRGHNGEVAAFKNTSNANSWLSVNVNNNTGIGGVVFGDSDAWAPAYVQYNHTNNIMQFISNDSERLRIKSDGSIQTTTRSAGLRRMILAGSPTNTAFNIEAHDGATGTASGTIQGELGLYYNDGTTLSDTATIKFERGNGGANGAMTFFTNNNERLRITSGGNIGMGVVGHNPLTRLHVQDSNNGALKDVLTITNENGNTNTEVGMVFECGTDEVARISAKNEGSDIGPLIFSTATSTNANPTEKLRIQSGGDVLIGTTTSAGKLTVDSGTSNTCATFQSSDAGAGINLKDNSARSSIEQNGATFKISSDTGAEHANSDIRLQVDGSTKMRIDSNGLVNIGAGSNASGLSPLLHLHKNASNSTAYLHITNNTTGMTNNDGFLLGINGVGDCLVFNKDSTPIRFATAGLERLRIENVNSARARFNFGSGNNDFTNPDIGGGTSGVSINKNTLGQIYACTDNADNTATNDYQTICLNLSRRNTSGDGPHIALDRGGWIKASIAGLQGSNTATSGPGSFVVYTHDYSSGQNVRTERLRIQSNGATTVGDGNNLAADYGATMLVDGGDNTRLTVYGSTTGTGTLAFSDGSGSSATKKAGFIEMNHTSNDNGPRLNMGLNNTTLVHIRVPGSNRGQLEIYGGFNESTVPAIEINDGGDARKVFLTNSSGDFNALTRNGSQTKGQLKMFESGVLLHNMKDPDSTNVLQTFRAQTYRTTTGSTNPSTSPDQTLIQKGGSGTYDCFYEGNMKLEVNGNNNDHYQPVAFVPLGYNLDTSSFGGQWAGEMWIHQTSSQNPENYGYDGYNNWATMSFKCRWDCAHWNAKPSGFWVEHYINQGRAQIAKIDASTTMSQFVIYLLPGFYQIRYNCIRGMSVHRSSSNGGSITLRDGGSMATYSTLAYSSRNTSFDSEITPGSGTFAHCT